MPQKLGEEYIEELARQISDMTLPNLNRLTLCLASNGVAASFNQYIPEINDDEIAAPEENSGPSFRDGDNAFGSREPG